MVNSHGHKCHFCRSRLHLYKRCPLYERLQFELAANVGINRVDYGGCVRWVHTHTGLYSSQLTDLVDFGWLLDANSRVWSEKRDSRGPDFEVPTLPVRCQNSENSNACQEMEKVIPVNTTPLCPVLMQPEPEVITTTSEIPHPMPNTSELSSNDNICDQPVSNSVDSEDESEEDEPSIVTWDEESRIACTRTNIIVPGHIIPAVLDPNSELSIMSYRTYDNLISRGCRIKSRAIPVNARCLLKDPSIPPGTNPHTEMVETDVHLNGKTVNGWFLLKVRTVPLYLVQRQEFDETVVGRNLLSRLTR